MLDSRLAIVQPTGHDIARKLLEQIRTQTNEIAGFTQQRLLDEEIHQAFLLPDKNQKVIFYFQEFANIFLCNRSGWPSVLEINLALEFREMSPGAEAQLRVGLHFGKMVRFPKTNITRIFNVFMRTVSR